MRSLDSSTRREAATNEGGVGYERSFSRTHQTRSGSLRRYACGDCALYGNCGCSCKARRESRKPLPQGTSGYAASEQAGVVHLTSSSRVIRQPSPRHRTGSRTTQTVSLGPSCLNRSRTPSAASITWYVRPSEPYSVTALPRFGSVGTLHRCRTLSATLTAFEHTRYDDKINYETGIRR